MSDGNFNRALLPHTPYASGLKAGKAIARSKAVEAFREWLAEAFPTLSAEEQQQHRDTFGRLLEHKIP